MKESSEAAGSYFLQNPNATMHEVQEHLAKNNFSILYIERVENDVLAARYKNHKDSYYPSFEDQSLHGTSRKNAESIAETGFDTTKSIRELWGKGTYCTEDWKRALDFAPVEGKEQTQTVIGISVKKGPIGLGTESQTDFGTDVEGRPIGTLTNPDQSVFCVQDASRIMVKFIFTLGYGFEKGVPINQIQARFGMIPQPVFLAVKRASYARSSIVQSAGRVNVSARFRPYPAVRSDKVVSSAKTTTVSSKTATYVECDSWNGKKQGDRVLINKVPTTIQFYFCVGKVGTIKQIEMCIGRGATHFYVEIPEFSQRLRELNSNKEMDESVRHCVCLRTNDITVQP